MPYNDTCHHGTDSCKCGGTHHTHNNHHNHTCCSDDIGEKTNTFLNINGIPYLIAEYMDTNQVIQLDRTCMRNEINVDNSEAMRSVVSININDIKMDGQGYPIIVGNNTQIEKLLTSIREHSEYLNQRLDVVKTGMIVRVNYRLENQRTGQVIRSTSEDFRINNRNYYMDINPKNINDNGLVINFSDMLVSTLTEFTHGIDRMAIRISSVHLMYECIRRDPFSGPNPGYSPYDSERIYPDNNYFRYHQRSQNRQIMGIPNDYRQNNIYDDPNLNPVGWMTFNRFYHFENEAKDIVIHQQEVCDSNNTIYYIPCGEISINRRFLVNPGHRIIFKFSIWKNDLASVADTRGVANALGVRCIPECPYPPTPPPINPDLEQLIRMIRENMHVDHRQDHQINWLSKEVKRIISGEDIEIKPVVPVLGAKQLQGGDIQLTWGAIRGSDGYILQCDSGSGFNTIYDGIGTSFIHDGLTIDEMYKYRVCSYKGDIHNDYSNDISVISELIPDPSDCTCDTIESIADQDIIDMLTELGLYP